MFRCELCGGNDGDHEAPPPMQGPDAGRTLRLFERARKIETALAGVDAAYSRSQPAALMNGLINGRA